MKSFISSSLLISAGLLCSLLVPHVSAQYVPSLDPNPDIRLFCQKAQTIAHQPTTILDDNLVYLLKKASTYCNFDYANKQWPAKPQCPAALTAVPAYCKDSGETPCAWHCVDLRTHSLVPAHKQTKALYQKKPIVKKVVKKAVNPSVTTAPKKAVAVPVMPTPPTPPAPASASMQNAFSSASAFVPTCPEGMHLDFATCLTSQGECSCVPNRPVPPNSSSAMGMSSSPAASIMCLNGKPAIVVCPEGNLYGPCQQKC